MGCGACVRLYPDIFEMKDGKAVVKKDGDPKDAFYICPVNAISVE